MHLAQMLVISMGSKIPNTVAIQVLGLVLDIVMEITWALVMLLTIIMEIIPVQSFYLSIKYLFM